MMCTPTRSSFQSGRLPIHVLTQLSSPCDKNGAIPRDMTGVAAQLKTAGYATHQGTLRRTPPQLPSSPAPRRRGLGACAVHAAPALRPPPLLG